MRTFTHLHPERVHTGAGSVSVLRSELERLGASRVLVLTTRSLAQSEAALPELERALGGLTAEYFSECSQHSPSGSVENAVQLADRSGSQAIVAFGGGSVIDTAKAAALELGVRRDTPAPPQVAVPTTLSAAEFTPVAGITDTDAKTKGLRVHADILPRVVVLDPMLARWTPRELWLTTGVKALDHALESLWALDPHPFVDALAEAAIARLRKWLALSGDPDKIEARGECQIGAWMSIAGVLNVGVRLSHPLGHQMGAYWGIPHGTTSCILLPAVMRALRDDTLEAQGRIATLLGVGPGNRSPEAVADEGVDALADFIASLGVPTRLREVGVQRSEIPEVADRVARELEQLGRPPRGGASELATLLESVWD